MPNIHCVPFVQLSDLLCDLKLLKEEFANNDGNADFSFGDNCYSLVSSEMILDYVASCLEDVIGSRIFIERLREIPYGIYIDLES